MTIPTGTYTLGPEHATLTVRTGKSGAAAKAGHNLLIEVTSWSATLQCAEDPAASALELTADSGSLEVRDGSGGLQALGADDKVSIKKSIDDEILKRGSIAFRSERIEPSADGGSLQVHGELDLLGARRPITFALKATDDGHLTASATITQSDFGIKPYSTLFGALKVVDDVQVELDGRLPTR
ncbi:MAG TPA: YceI family protein [Solirubrobacteraceae bacterium]|nr:YceI family protein [Solirubrobacteraceae bacterium]